MKGPAQANGEAPASDGDKVKVHIFITFKCIFIHTTGFNFETHNER